ncbi:SDR family NAD(P)-dependent oxidoreductase [Paenibacillus sp. 2RAB27]|uniref:SDR family NAD(P)-dependent oxidoreductase n=1 Tax=Paenibacillus sp. 2RAB27 TaxID=3232991 RepID=UPI003F97F6B1
MDLIEKIALVTGGGRGIGRETCILLAKQGAKVAVFSDNLLESQDTANYITQEMGREAISLVGDVRSEEDVERAVMETQQRWGSIDILVNNAGVMSIKPFHKMEIEEWDYVQDVNIRGVFLFARAVVPQMIEKRNGVIINLSSIWGTKGGPDRSAYITSKHAVMGFTKALGEELKPYKIRVNAVCPGPVDTQMMKEIAPDVNKENWLHPRDIAHVIAELCLPEMAAVTGTAIEAFGSGRPVSL